MFCQLFNNKFFNLFHRIRNVFYSECLNLFEIFRALVHFKAEESDDRHSRFQPGGHAGQRIFNYDAVFRLKSHAAGGQQKQIRFRFAVFDHIGGKYFVFAEITADADRLYLGQRLFLDAAGSDALPQTGVAEDIFDSFRQFYAFFQQFVISVQRFFPERVVGDNAEPVEFFFLVLSLRPPR